MKFIKLNEIKIEDIATIEATTQSTMITLYNGDYIQVHKKLKEVLKELV